MTGRNGNRRRVLVVDRELQRTFVTQVVTVPMVAILATVVVVGVFCWKLQAEAEASGQPLVSLVPLFAAVLTFFLASSFAMFHYAAAVSNRVAGPQVNVRRTVERYLAGDRNARVKLRQRDYLHGVADDVNRLLDELATTSPELDQVERETAGVAD